MEMATTITGMTSAMTKNYAKNSRLSVFPFFFSQIVFVVFFLATGFHAPKVSAKSVPANLPQPQGAAVVTFPSKPPYEEKAKTARFVTHISSWGSLATISSHDPIKGYPFAKVFSISDGIPGKSSTGIPYLYMTPMDVSAQDVAVDPRVTLSLSEAQSDICLKEEEDPQSPICAKVMITGQIVKITDQKEVSFAWSVLLSRHPDMASWPVGHGWFFARLEPKQVQLLDYYGGITTLTPEEYFQADPLV